MANISLDPFPRCMLFLRLRAPLFRTTPYVVTPLLHAVPSVEPTWLCRRPTGALSSHRDAYERREINNWAEFENTGRQRGPFERARAFIRRCEQAFGGVPAAVSALYDNVVLRTSLEKGMLPVPGYEFGAETTCPRVSEQILSFARCT